MWSDNRGLIVFFLSRKTRKEMLKVRGAFNLKIFDFSHAKLIQVDYECLIFKIWSCRLGYKKSFD